MNGELVHCQTVADARNVIGFDPFVDLVDLIEQRATARIGAAA